MKCSPCSKGFPTYSTNLKVPYTYNLHILWWLIIGRNLKKKIYFSMGCYQNNTKNIHFWGGCHLLLKIYPISSYITNILFRRPSLQSFKLWCYGIVLKEISPMDTWTLINYKTWLRNIFQGNWNVKVQTFTVDSKALYINPKTFWLH